MPMGPSFRTPRTAFAASIEERTAEKQRLLSLDSPNKARYFAKPSFRKSRAAFAASIEERKAEEKRLSSLDSPNKAQYFADDITTASFTDSPVSEIPKKRIKWTIPEFSHFPPTGSIAQLPASAATVHFLPTDPVAPSPAPAVSERKRMLAIVTMVDPGETRRRLRDSIQRKMNLSGKTIDDRNRVHADSMNDTRFTWGLFPNDGNDDKEEAFYSNQEESDDDGHSCFPYEPLPIKYDGDDTGNQDYPHNDDTDPHRGSAEPGAAATATAVHDGYTTEPGMAMTVALQSLQTTMSDRAPHDDIGNQDDPEHDDTNSHEGDPAEPGEEGRGTTDAFTDVDGVAVAIPDTLSETNRAVSVRSTPRDDDGNQNNPRDDDTARLVNTEGLEAATATREEEGAGDQQATDVSAPSTVAPRSTHETLHETEPQVHPAAPGAAAAASNEAGEVPQLGRIVRFAGATAFRNYFDRNKTLIMRKLLTQFTTATTADGIVDAPSFHLVSHVPDESIATAFFKAFTYECFGVEDGGHVPLAFGTLRTYEDALNDVFASREAAKKAAEIQLNACKDEVKACQAKVNAAKGARREQLVLELPPKERAVNNIFYYLRCLTKTLTADGGDTNGELTREKAILLIQRLIDQHGLNALSVLMDGGANYNLFVALVAQLANCKAFGIEYVPVRTFVAASAYLAAMSDKEHKGGLINERVAYVTCDLLNLRSIGPATHAYYFDEAFDPWLVEHNIKVCANTPSITHICSFKASKSKSVHRIFEEYGFMMVDRLSVSKTGSGEHNTVYIYKRTSNVAVSWPDTGCNILSQERLLADSLEPAWSSNREDRLQMYKRLKTTTEGLLNLQKRARKMLKRIIPGTGMAAATPATGTCHSLIWFECSKGCKTCDYVFKHRPDAVQAQKSSIDGKGLFAADAILANTMVIEYTGSWSTEEPGVNARRYTVKLDARTYIDAAEAGGPHKYVNHSCNPNARFLRWTSNAGNEKLSIQVVRPLKSGDEITVDYTNINSIEKDFCFCACLTCKQKPPVVLCLGMVFSTNKVNMDALVQSKTISIIDGRDSVRCMAMEAFSNVDVYTLDKRSDGNRGLGRHIECFFDHRSLPTKIRQCITEPIKQICLDFFYMPNSFTQTLGKKLFGEQLKAFAPLLSQDGCVYFPFQRDILSALIDGERTWEGCYDVSFANKDVPAEMEANLLFAGSNQISEDRMYGVYRKEPNQVEKYCITAVSEITELRKRNPESSICLLLDTKYKGQILSLRFIRFGKK
jgi:hypothetical protein